jgi:hypothetical protein
MKYPYNCMVLEHEGALYTIANNDWNQDIRPGDTVTIGFTTSSDDGKMQKQRVRCIHNGILQ